MDYYVLNTSLRLRDRRHSAVIVIDGRKVTPGQRFPLDGEGIRRNFSQLYHLQSIGAVEIRDAASGLPVGLSKFAPEAKAVPVTKRTEPRPELVKSSPKADFERPPGVSDLISMADEGKTAPPAPVDTPPPPPPPVALPVFPTIADAGEESPEEEEPAEPKPKIENRKIKSRRSREEG